MALAGQHPYFDDQRTARWHTDLGEALAAARGEGRRVLLLLGRRGCGGTRALVEKTLPKAEIAEFLRDHFVCLAVDGDAALAAPVDALLSQVPRREPTPVCVYLDEEGRPAHSTVGGRPAAVFLRDMTEAAARKAPAP
jgi:hypothetical protein